MESTWPTGDANARLEFSGEARFLIFTQKWLLGNTGYLVSFKRKSLKSNGFTQNIALSNLTLIEHALYKKMQQLFY